MKETDLDSVKRIAKGLLNIDVLETEYSPMIVSHPFTKCGIITLLDGEEFVQLDITRNKESLNKWKTQIEKQIDEAQNVYHVYYLLNDSYRLMFFNDVSKFLSKQEFSDILGDIWVISEYANQDANVTKKQMLKHFKNADKSILMTESEQETFAELDDIVVVYRGVSTKNKNNIKALSWTTSFGKAKWFAERWGDKGTVYSATIGKENIFAYFDRKNEDEVVLDYNALQNIKVARRPEHRPEQGVQSME